MIVIKRTQEVKKWLKSLKNKTTRAKILIRIERMQENNFGDVKPVGHGISELRRIHHGKGYRVYFTHHNNQIILLLCGGNKSTQPSDIKKAKQIAKVWGEISNEN